MYRIPSIPDKSLGVLMWFIVFCLFFAGLLYVGATRRDGPPMGGATPPLRLQPKQDTRINPIDPVNHVNLVNPVQKLKMYPEFKKEGILLWRRIWNNISRFCRMRTCPPKLLRRWNALARPPQAQYSEDAKAVLGDVSYCFRRNSIRS